MEVLFHTFYYNFGQAEEIVPYTKDFIIQRSIKLKFHCGWFLFLKHCYVLVLVFGVWSEVGPVPEEDVLPLNHLQSNSSDWSCL